MIIRQVCLVGKTNPRFDFLLRSLLLDLISFVMKYPKCCRTTHVCYDYTVEFLVHAMSAACLWRNVPGATLTCVFLLI